MKTIRTILLLTLSLQLLFTSCAKRGGSFLPTASGAPFELLVVVNKEMWKRNAGEAIRDVLESDVPGLPQSEPNFKLSVVDPTHFDNLLRPVRNVLIVEVSDIYSKGSTSYARDVYSADQVIMTVKAGNEQQLAEYLRENQSNIVRFFVNSELNRNINFFSKKFNTALLNGVRENFYQAEVKAPGDLKNEKIGKDFIWVTNDAAKGRMDLVIYSVPYHNINDFSEERLIAVRDSVMKENIKGSKESMYMQTEVKYAPVLCDTIGVNGKFTVRLRGLWQMQGDMMGGPFVSHTRLDEKNQRIVTIEGFVFAPEMPKRNLLRRVEAMLYTLRFSDEINSNLELNISSSESK
ncbi:MAG: DUF4837 family protein [Bacteroidales bacterium]